MSKIKWIKKTNIYRVFCNHNFKNIGIDFEIAYDTHYYGTVSEFKCFNCGKEKIKTTSKIYIKLPYK